MGGQVAQNQKTNSQEDKREPSQREAGGIATFQFQDNRSETSRIQKIQAGGDNTLQAKQLTQLQTAADTQNNQFIQKKSNDTGLPDNLKSGVENLSGYSMNDVKVHYNSDKPTQLQAHAYAQGSDIHVAPGQEKHLPHEAWHVVQQKQGRVSATAQLKGNVAVNDDSGLEKEADVMGAKALEVPQQSEEHLQTGINTIDTTQLRRIDMGGHGELEIGNFAGNLAPDDPQGYGDTADLFGDTVATSMSMLVTPNHPQGSSPKEQNDLFSQLPTIGKYKLDANNGKPKTGSNIYIKGHLLNDNLGGPGVSNNLFPITHQANVDHDNLVEEPIKEWVNKHGGIVHYTVNVIPGPTGITNVKNETNGNLNSVDAQFEISVAAFTQAGSEVVADGKIINSTWGNNPGNGGPINFAGVPVVAPTFSAAAVKLPPRAQIKKDWDEAYLQIATHIASTTKVPLDNWLKAIDGIGPASVKALKEVIDPATLSKSGKGTLTKARGLLKQFVDEKYSVYLQVSSANGSEEADVDTGNQDPGTDLISTNIKVVNSTLDELDLLISEFKGFSLGPDDGSASSSDGGYQSPFYARGSYGKEVSSPHRSIPEDSLQGDAFIQWRDVYPADSGQDLETNCRNYISAIAPRVNPEKLLAFLTHAEKVRRMDGVALELTNISIEQWWIRFTKNVNTAALYYEANFPEGVFRI